MSAGPVLVVGATGALGQKVVDALLRRGKKVRALVRASTDAGSLEAKGVEISRGDMLDMASLERAMSGAGHVGERVRVTAIPWWLLSAGLGVAGLFSPEARDIKAMLRFFQSGRYVADPTRQSQVFGRAPTAEDAVLRWLQKNGLAADAGRKRGGDPSLRKRGLSGRRGGVVRAAGHPRDAVHAALRAWRKQRSRGKSSAGRTAG
ncbi:MAG: NmrA family NAD(P)-binding protein [Polyangiaceae bacterium]